MWVGGQSNSVGTNSQVPGQYPTWPANPLIQMFCAPGRLRSAASKGCVKGNFATATTPVYGESNVGFSLTFANLLLQTLPAGHGVVLVNTGVGGTGFHDGNWVAPDGPLALNSIAAVEALHAALPAGLGGFYSFHSILWHQGELDAGDNRGGFHAPYCQYLIQDLSPLVDLFRASFPGASPSTPFIDGGLLPYWEDAAANTSGVVAAISALNTSRACTATADSRVFADFLPNGAPNGDPKYRSGASGDVIHFTATQAFFLGQQYFVAYQKALNLTTPVPSAETGACPGAAVQPSVAACG